MPVLELTFNVNIHFYMLLTSFDGQVADGIFNFFLWLRLKC